jgi:phytoene dehydrogenase-like protein
MTYDVVVVGAGIGGLTAAALLAKRGLDVCVLERQSQVGGCIARVEFGGFDFEPGMGIYPAWGPNGIYERLFAELAVAIPKAEANYSDYLVRLPNDCDIRLKHNDADFFAELHLAFPECADAAIEFYDHVNTLNREADKGLRSFPNQNVATSTALAFAEKTSNRFQRFIDSQLRAFLNTPIDRCSFAAASQALSLPRNRLYSIEGGISTLAERLAESIKSAGGVVRLNSPVLRLVFSDSGEAIGVVLLSGETVFAKRAIISNLTLWDTFGKLIGLNRTPSAIKSALNKVNASGVFVIYAAVDGAALKRLPGRNFLVAKSDSTQEENLSGEIAVTIGIENDNGLAAATLKTGTEVASWFAFQTSEEDYEQWDQAELENVWSKLHQTVPEFGSGIEVIETANPRTYYDLTRRKLGMVMGPEASIDNAQLLKDVAIPFPNVFMVGDTIAAQPQLNSIVESAFELVERLMN